MSRAHGCTGATHLFKSFHPLLPFLAEEVFFRLAASASKFGMPLASHGVISAGIQPLKIFLVTDISSHVSRTALLVIQVGCLTQILKRNYANYANF